MAKYVENFYEWVFNWYEKATADPNMKFVTCNNKITIACDINTGECVSARCKPAEEFDNVIGIGVAYARFCGEEIPKEKKVTVIGKLAPGTKFEMKYPRRSEVSKWYSIVGVFPYDERFICYCDNEKNFYTTIRNREVIIIN